MRARYPDHEGYVDHGDGVRVFFEVYGDGPGTVCFLPVWPVTHSRAWKAQIPYLARHFRVIAIDPRGNGRSDRPTSRTAYSRDAHVADVLAVLDDTGTDAAMLVTVSPRAPLALQLAVDHPTRVRAVVFITPQLWRIKEFMRPFAASGRDRFEGYDKFNPRYWKQDYAGFVEWFAKSINPHPHSTRQIEDTISYGMATDPETLIAATVGFEMYERDEALGLASQISCPVLVTQNGGDAMWPKECSGPLAEASGGQLHVFEGLGPAIAGRWPVAMNIVLREFFESVTKRPARAQAACASGGVTS